jgi:hypothetical protein
MTMSWLPLPPLSESTVGSRTFPVLFAALVTGGLEQPSCTGALAAEAGSLAAPDRPDGLGIGDVGVRPAFGVACAELQATDARRTNVIVAVAIVARQPESRMHPIFG